MCDLAEGVTDGAAKTAEISDPALVESRPNSFLGVLRSLASNALTEANICSSPFNQAKFRSLRGAGLSDNAYSSDSEGDQTPLEDAEKRKISWDCVSLESIELKVNATSLESFETLLASEPAAFSEIFSILPRNYSNDSNTALKILAQKMYAWQEPPKLPSFSDFSQESVSSTINGLLADPGMRGLSLDSTQLGDSGSVLSSEITPTMEVQQPLRPLAIEDNKAIVPFDCFDGHMPRSKSPLYHENEYVFYQPKRSSSLKSPRIYPEGSSPVKKAVRFADAFGLDLVMVKQVFDTEDPPKIPASAIHDLHLDTNRELSTIGDKHFSMCFPQPGASLNFLDRVRTQHVCLENARIDTSRGVLTGLIRVHSLSFEKKIVTRISYNNWATFSDCQASYVANSHDGVTDQFSFSVVFPTSVVSGDAIQFTLMYETPSREQFWDNNYGSNYKIFCYAKQTFMNNDDHSWVNYL